MNEHRNLLLALLLSAIVLIGWSFLSSRFIQPANPPSTQVVKGKPVPVPEKGSPAVQTEAAIRNRDMVLKETPRAAIDTPSLQGSINLKGARIDDLVLVRHRETIAKDSPPVRLLSPSGTLDSYFGGFGWNGQGISLPGPDTVWTASAPRLAPGSPLTLSWDNGQGQIFQIKLAVDDNYMFAVDQRVENRGSSAVAVQPYTLISRVGVSKDPDSWTKHTGPIGVFDHKVNYINFKDVDAGAQRFTTTGGWLGFTDNYWLTAIIPDQGHAVDASFRAGANHNYQADFAAAQSIVGPGQVLDYQSRFFGGAKEFYLLRNYTNAGVPFLDYSIDWGWFWFFEKPIFTLLDFLFKMIGNFGGAIICLTLLMRTVMFPIAQKQFKSMAAMRELQPKVKALQDRHKGDKVQLQQEMMKLYQEEKVNPLAGCLPTVIQIPIWYALYKVLMLTIEMRHQPFALWLKDLSAPDPMTPINLFGYLHFAPPEMLAIGILPIIVATTMYMQFRLNPQAPDPVQQQVMSVMPWAMMFVMARFAAGLQLYWATSNLLTIAQQRWLYHRYPQLKAATQTK